VKLTLHHLCRTSAGYDFEYEAHAIAFTDLYSEDCQPPELVFFDEDESIVARAALEGMTQAQIVAQLARRGIKASVRKDPSRSSKRKRGAMEL
jgi:hypothetical protein